MKNLELLDVSYNKLSKINQIVNMQKLRILILNGNKQLCQLPAELATCDSLIDISFDADNITDPPSDIIELGTLEILRYLSTGEKSVEVMQDKQKELKNITNNFINTEKGFTEYEKNSISDVEKRARERKFMEHERGQNERFNQMDQLMHERNQLRKQEFLKNLLQQQNQTDEMLRNLQKDKDVERTELIGKVLKEEHNAGIIIDKLLSLKNGPDADLLECERIEQERLLENLRVDNVELRKRDILSAMSEVLENEAQQIKMYHERRDENMKMLMELETDLDIEKILKNQDRSRQMALVAENEEWQKAVVGTFIEQNDARTWGLVEQVRLVEAQLASMTRCEIDRRKCELDGRVVRKPLFLEFILLIIG